MQIEIEDNRSKAFKAGVWYIVSNIVVKAIVIITAPVFTRIMTTEEYGAVQTFVSWYSLLLPFFSLNLAYSVGRAKIDYEGHLDKFIGSMQLLSGGFSLFVSIAMLFSLKYVSSAMELTSFQTILLLVYIVFEPAILMYQTGCKFTYKYKQNIVIALYTVISTTLLSLILILVFKENKDDMRIIGMVAPILLLSSFVWIKALKRGNIKPNKEYFRYALRICLPLIVHTMSIHVLSQSDRIFITKIWGKSYTALYSLAYTYGSLLHIFTTAAADSWLPWFHDTYHIGEYDRIRDKSKDMVLVGCYIGLASVAFAPEAIWIFGGEKYAESVMCVPPIVLGVICQYIYTHYVNIELHLKKTSYVSAGTITVAMLNVGLNAIFIPKFGYIAAAYTTLASYLVLFLIHFCITRYVLKVKVYDDVFMFATFVVCAILAAVLMYSYNHTLLRLLIIAIGFASFVYYFRRYAETWLKKRKKKK